MARLVKKSFAQTFVKARGWGSEVWIENRPDYCGKILKIYGGKRGSLHFHKLKNETMYLQSGSVEIRFIDTDTGIEESLVLMPGDSVMIEAGQPHQIVGLLDSEILEFSTQHFENDSYRIRKGD